MDKIHIIGERPLSGDAAVSGAKNAALPILASALLTDGWNRFENIPDLMDIQSIILLLQTLGAEVKREGSAVCVDASGLSHHEAPYDLVRKMRASILVLGPLVARLGKARVSLPGGCAIGARPIDLHLKGLARLGAKIDLAHGYVEARASGLVGADIFFDTVSVTGTENIMMAACLAKGTTVLRNAAREPEITALAEALTQMGAKIKGAGSAMITIEGVKQLSPANFTNIPDRIEAGTLMVAAALSRGDVRVTGCRPDHMQSVIHKLRQTGTVIEPDGPNVLRVQGPEAIASVDMKTQVYPGFPTDMQAQFMVLMTKAGGLSLISETIFENRFIHVAELRRMGADISVSGNNAVVKGVPSLLGAPVMASDLRASASLILAGLAARGETVVNRVYHLDRGYESLEKKFAKLGACIWREKG